MVRGLKNNEPEELMGTQRGQISRHLGDSFNLRLLIHYVGDIH